MLKKLLKYEFRAMGKDFFFLWWAVLGLAVVNRFVLSGPTVYGDVSEEMEAVFRSMQLSSPLATVFIFAFAAVMIAMFVLTLIFIIQRFYKGLLGTEGYLMNTLPVKSWQLITTKLIGAVALTAANGIVAFLSLLLMVPSAFEQVGELSSMLWAVIVAQGSLSLPVLLFSMAVTLVQGPLHLYLAMAMGHLSDTHRIAISAAAFVMVNILANMFGNLFSNLVVHFAVNSFGLPFPDASGYLLIEVVFSLILCTGYFFITNSILSKRLNLE